MQQARLLDQIFGSIRSKAPEIAKKIYHTMKIITVTLLVFSMACSSYARILYNWNYKSLYEQADLVIIGKPISSKDTAEKATLPNIAPDVHVTGLSTEVEISVVMKGDKSLKKAVLHHYRLSDPNACPNNGPVLVSFDPNQQTQFLMFLRLEKDGRYSPVSGQTDPALFSILKLDGLAQ